MSKICTDIPQSQRLLELGLSPETANMYYKYVLPKSGKLHHIPEIGNPINALEWYNKGYAVSGKQPLTLEEFCIPAWSFEALTELKHDLQGCVTILIKGEKGCCMSIAHPIFLTVTETEMMTNSPLDVAFEMVCWLLKNGHIKTGKK